MKQRVKSRPVSTGLLAAAALAVVGAAHGEEVTDLRGIKVGMAVKELPADGYRNFACAGAAEKKVAGWSDWRNCGLDAAGLHALKVEYDQPGREGTFIAGHPVNLTLFFDEQARLARVTIETDPKARLYLRKKAYLLGQQAKYRYGENRWECMNAKPASGEEPLGPTFIKEHCTKKLNDREVVIDRDLFRKAGSDPKSFSSQSRVSISWLGKQT